MLVMVQEGVEPEERQRDFIREAESWEHGIMRRGFTDPDQLRDVVTRSLHDYMQRAASGTSDPDELRRRVKALLPEGRSVGGGARLHLIVAGGPPRTVLSPVELGDGELARSLQERLTFRVPVLDNQESTDIRSVHDSLVFHQRAAEVVIHEDGSLRLTVAARTGDRQPHSVAGMAIIEEDLNDRIVELLQAAGLVLDEIDPVARLRDVLVQAAFTGASCRLADESRGGQEPVVDQPRDGPAAGGVRRPADPGSAAARSTHRGPEPYRRRSHDTAAAGGDVVNVLDTEAIRRRWTTARNASARNALLTGVGDRCVDITVLAVDPAASVISEFNDETRQWWRNQTGEAPFGAQLPFEIDTSTATHLIRARRRGETWNNVLALGRDGSVVAGSSVPSYEVGGCDEPQRCFRLRWLVGLTWIVVAAAAASIERFGMDGPFPFYLGLEDTRGAELGDVGDGWREPGRGLHDTTGCGAETVRIVHELTSWPTAADEIEEFVHRVGGNIEDAFGWGERRFLSRTGDYEASLDLRHWRL